MKKTVRRIASLFAILTLGSVLFLMACAPAAVPPAQPAATTAPAAATQAPTEAPQPTAVPPTAAPTTAPAEPTQAPAPAVSDRSTTLILDTEGGQVADSKNFNPYSGGRGGSNGVVNALVEPVFTTNLVTGEFEPWLGESMTANDDFTVWTLKLRKGIEWSDGTPLTADDVVFTVEMIQKFPDLSTPHKFKDVGVKKIDDLTVEFTLPASDPRFQLTVWAGQLQSQEIRIVPKHIWESVADPVTFTNYDPDKGWPVFTGAWTLDRVVSDTEFQYKLNENWWGAKSGWRELPAVKTIVWTLLGDENTRAAALEKGDIDQMAIASPSTFLTLIARNPEITAWSKNPPYGNPDVCGRNLEFNHTVAPWDDPEMRWAVAKIIDREKLIDIAYNGFTTPAYNFLPPFEGLDKFRDLLESKGIYAKYPIQTVDPAAAKGVFEAKGYKLNGAGIYEKDGKPLAATIVNFDDTIINSMNGALIEQLRAAGIDAKQDIQPIPTFVPNLLNNKLEVSIFFGSCGSTVDPWKSMDSYSVRHIPEGDGPISGFYSNSWRWNTETAKKYSEIVDQIGKLVPGDPKIDELWIEAMDLWYSELPGIPLVSQYLIWPINPSVWTNWPTEENGYVQPDMAGTNTLIILHNLKPAK